MALFKALPNPPLPVALRARRDGWTPDRQRRFVAALAASRSVTAAAAMAGTSVRSADKLRDHPEAAALRTGWYATLLQPNLVAGPSLVDKALARETVKSIRAGLGESGHFRIDRPVRARVTIRLLGRIEAKMVIAQNRANS